MVDIMIIFGGGFYVYVEAWNHGGTEACRCEYPFVGIETLRYGGVKGCGRVGMMTCRKDGLVEAWARGSRRGLEMCGREGKESVEVYTFRVSAGA